MSVDYSACWFESHRAAFEVAKAAGAGPAAEWEGAPAPKTPAKAVNRRESPPRSASRGQGSQTLPPAAVAAIAEIRQLVATETGGITAVAGLLGVDRSTISKALAGTYPTVPHRLLEAWARHRAAQPSGPCRYLVRVVRLGRVLVDGRYFSAPELARLNGRQVVLQPDPSPGGEHRHLVYAGHPLQVVCHAAARAAGPQGETA